MNRHDPDVCWSCGHRGRIIDRERCIGYIRRRHECRHGCLDPHAAGKPRRWSTYQSRYNPKRVLRRVLQGRKPRGYRNHLA